MFSKLQIPSYSTVRECDLQFTPQLFTYQGRTCCSTSKRIVSGPLSRTAPRPMPRINKGKENKKFIKFIVAGYILHNILREFGDVWDHEYTQAVILQKKIDDEEETEADEEEE